MLVAMGRSVDAAQVEGLKAAGAHCVLPRGIKMKLRGLVVSAVVFAGFAVALPPAAAQADPPRVRHLAGPERSRGVSEAGYASGRVLVRFKSGASATARS